MRDRLKKLFQEAKQEYLCKGKSGISKRDFTIDHLLYRGVIAPPCSLGETVYSCHGRTEVVEGKVCVIYLSDVFGMSIGVRYTDGLNHSYSTKAFGETVFLTKEEAEKALRGEGE